MLNGPITCYQILAFGGSGLDVEVRNIVCSPDRNGQQVSSPCALLESTRGDEHPVGALTIKPDVNVNPVAAEILEILPPRRRS